MKKTLLAISCGVFVISCATNQPVAQVSTENLSNHSAPPATNVPPATNSPDLPDLPDEATTQSSVSNEGIYHLDTYKPARKFTPRLKTKTTSMVKPAVTKIMPVFKVAANPKHRAMPVLPSDESAHKAKPKSKPVIKGGAKKSSKPPVHKTKSEHKTKPEHNKPEHKTKPVLKHKHKSKK